MKQEDPRIEDARGLKKSDLNKWCLGDWCLRVNSALQVCAFERANRNYKKKKPSLLAGKSLLRMIE